MIVSSSLCRLLQLSAVVAVSALALTAQTSTPHTTGGIPMREESHHHLVFANQYVNVFFVEIPPHETTLLHHHDLPYVSIPPGNVKATSPQAGIAPQAGIRIPNIPYAVGGFSHAVTNSGDATLRNIAVEVIHPQGSVRNRCEEVVPGQPLVRCDMPPSTNFTLPMHYALFETDEILVEDWEVGPNVEIVPADSRYDMLIGGASGIEKARVSTSLPDDPVPWTQGGLLWLRAKSPTILTFGPNGGHFIAILFKDSKPIPDRE